MSKYKTIPLPPQCYDPNLHGDKTYHAIFTAVILELSYLGWTFQYDQGQRAVTVKTEHAKSLCMLMAKWVIRAMTK